MIVVTGLNRGGAETQVTHLAKAFAREGHQVIVVSLIPPADFVDELHASGVAVYHLSMSRGRANPVAVLRLAGLIRRIRPDVVHSHMVHANLLCRAARMLSPVPVLVCTSHGERNLPQWRKVAYRVTDWLCDLTTEVSLSGVKRFAANNMAPLHKLRFVPNGVDIGRFSVGPPRVLRDDNEGLEKQFVWLAVGRLAKQKDYPTLLYAFAKVHTRYPNARLLIAGEGDMRERLQHLTAQLMPAGAIRLLGLRTDIPELMRSADAFVLSSAWEGTPMVLLEAAASGLPIVATSVDGNTEAVVQGKTGLLVPPGNPEKLADAMMELMSMSAQKRAQMGIAGRMHVEERYGLDRVARMWLEIYADLEYAKHVR